MTYFSRFIAAILLYIVVNQLVTLSYIKVAFDDALLNCQSSDPITVLQRKVQLVFHTWDDRAVIQTLKDFDKFGRKADLQFLGSSVIFFPFWELDRANSFRGVGEKAFFYHQCQTLNSQLAKSGFQDVQLFSFATPLQMASDANYFLHEYIIPGSRAKTIILCSTPRDFYDASFPEPLNSYNMRALITICHQLGVLSYFPGDPQRKVELLFSAGSFLFAKRSCIQELLFVFYNRTAYKLALKSSIRLRPSQFEYDVHYKNISLQAFSVQERYLMDLLETARMHGLKVGIVNFPLRPDNLAKLPTGFYNAYLHWLSNCCSRVHANFYDLSESSEFRVDDFADETHLNLAGARKLLPGLTRTCKDLLSN